MQQKTAKKTEKRKKHKRSAVVTRQRMAYNKMVENGGNMSKAMKDIGYSETYAHNPQKLTNTKAWGEIMDEALPDDMLASKHQKLLNATKMLYASFPRKMKPKDAMDIVRSNGHEPINHAIFQGQLHIFYFAPDHHFIDAGIDMAYKIKGRYKETIRIENDKWRKKSNKEIADIIAAGKKLFMKK